MLTPQDMHRILKCQACSSGAHGTNIDMIGPALDCSD